MLGKDVVDEELKRGFGMSLKEIEPLLEAGGVCHERRSDERCLRAALATAVALLAEVAL
jgi:hypothetical protein